MAAFISKSSAGLSQCCRIDKRSEDKAFIYRAPGEQISYNNSQIPLLNTTPVDKMSVIIETLTGNEENDVMHMRPWREEAFRLLPISVVISLLLNLLVMSAQFGIQKTEAPQKSRLFLLIMWITELGLAGIHL
jgi:hypothetical protein